MYGPDVAILLMYGSHNMRHTGFHRLAVVNGTLGNWGVTRSTDQRHAYPRNRSVVALARVPKH